MGQTPRNEAHIGRSVMVARFYQRPRSATSRLANKPLSSGAMSYYAKGMNYLRSITLAGITMLAGCGESPQQQLAQSPQVQQRLREIAEKNRAFEKKRQRILDRQQSAKNSAESLSDQTPALLPGNRAADDRSSDGPSSGDGSETPAARPSRERQPLSPQRLSPWQRLRRGLSQKVTRNVIRQLLGTPTVIKRDAFLEYWYYGQGAGAGKISFVIRSGQMLGWDPPWNPPPWKP